MLQAFRAFRSVERRPSLDPFTETVSKMREATSLVVPDLAEAFRDLMRVSGVPKVAASCEDLSALLLL